MFSIKKITCVLFLLTFWISGNSFANGVFVQKKRASHQLTGAEKKKMNIEFLKRFGSQKAATAPRSNNPWEAKKNRNQQSTKRVSWGQCREYALQKRNLCYKKGREAYRCERFYEARSNKCNADY